jgi:simple sugar transport system ATP-binding protein
MSQTDVLIWSRGRQRSQEASKAPNPREKDTLALLELHDVGKEFGAIRALSNVNLTIQPGEVVGLMGDNGAGKSTLVKIIAGNFPASHGRIDFEGREVHFAKPIDARTVGIEVVYQDLALADNLTAAANVFLGREMKRKVGPFSFLDHGAMNRRTGELFRELKSETRPDDVVRSMSGGQRQAVAIARTRLARAKLILMDEPTAAISVRQVAEVLDLIRRLRDAGIAVILISHRMPDVFSVCERVVVMRRGTKVADKAIGLSSPEEVTALITGAKEAA